jgi:hypothetical protein
LCSGGARFKFSAGISAMLTEVFLGFPRPLQKNSLSLTELSPS